MELSRYSIDVRTAMEELYIGPQADVLRKVDRLNSEYVHDDNLKIGITPKFRWKPGTYDKVKEILMQQWLQWHRRPSGMNSIFSREQAYTKNRLKEALIEIENILYNFRAENRTFINDPEEVRGHFELFKATLLSELEKVNNYFPNSSINILAEDDFSNAIIETVINVEEINIAVSVGNRSGETRELGSVDYGDIKLRFKMPLCRWFNIIYNYCNIEENSLNSSNIRVDSGLLTHHGHYGRRWNQKNFECIAEIYPKQIGALHPYVARSGYGTGNVCMGEMMRDIIKSFLVLDWNSMSYWIDLWLKSYKCGVTGPLNNINMAIVGRPRILLEGEDNSVAFYEVVGEPSHSSCWDRVWSTLSRDIEDGTVQLEGNETIQSVIIEQCDNISCTLRDDCRGYLANTKGLALREDIHKFIDQECKFDVLMPSEQEEDGDVYHFMDVVRESCYTDNPYNIDMDWGLLEDSFRQKSVIQGLKLLEYMINENLVKIHNDDAYHDQFINNLLACKNNDMIWDVMEMPSQAEPMSDEQEEMAAWAHAIRQR